MRLCHSSLGTLLADYLREVHHVLTRRLFTPLGVPGQFSIKPCVPDKEIAAIFLFLKNPDDIGQSLHPEY